MKLTVRLAAAAFVLLASHSALAFFIPRDVQVVEFVNEITGHYVLLQGQEVNDVLNGSAGPGWVQTGQFFYEPDPSFYGGLVSVCRFYSPVFNSHFLTANEAECEGLKSNRDWVYEKVPFLVESAAANCPNGHIPVYRLYNNRAALRDANHRFTPDAATRDEMVASGWVDEGVAWCALTGGVGPMKTR